MTTAVCVNRNHVGGCACEAGGDAEFQSYFVGRSVQYAVLDICDFCNQREARIALKDDRNESVPICDHCFERLTEDDE